MLFRSGPELAAAALRQGCVQQLAAVIAPKLLGGEPARTPLGRLEAETLAETWGISESHPRWLATDLLWLGTARPPGRSGEGNGGQG